MLMIRIFVVDDYLLFCEVLSGVLEFYFENV